MPGTLAAKAKRDRTRDPRYLRTRRQLQLAVNELLVEGSRSVTFALVAQRARVNRGTVHQHYGTRQELVADAYAARIAELAEHLQECPLNAPADEPPAAIVDMFDRARALDLSSLDVVERALLNQNLANRLAEGLVEQFREGKRPRSAQPLRPSAHASFIAGGLTRLLLDPEGQATARDGWALISTAPRT